MVSAGSKRTACITSLGRVVAWSNDASGEWSTPEICVEEAFTMVSVGANHTLALTSSGRIMAWGSNDYGQITVPPVQGDEFFTMVAAGISHSAALKNTGLIIAWGKNKVGQCCGTHKPSNTANFEFVAAGGNTTVGLTETRRLVIWGSNCGESAPDECFSMVSVGDSHFAGLTESGRVVCWGSNREGQCQVPEHPLGEIFIAVDAGSCQTLGLTNTGRVWGWGSRLFGRGKQFVLHEGRHFVAVTSGGTVADPHSAGLTNTGHIISWGCQNCAPRLPTGEKYVASSARHYVSIHLFATLVGSYVSIDCRSLGGELLTELSLKAKRATVADLTKLLRTKLLMPFQAIFPDGWTLDAVHGDQLLIHTFNLSQLPLALSCGVTASSVKSKTNTELPQKMTWSRSPGLTDVSTQASINESPLYNSSSTPLGAEPLPSVFAQAHPQKSMGSTSGLVETLDIVCPNSSSGYNSVLDSHHLDWPTTEASNSLSGWLVKRGQGPDCMWERVWCTYTLKSFQYWGDKRCILKKGEIQLSASSRTWAFDDGEAPGDAAKYVDERPHGFVLDPNVNARKRQCFYFDAMDPASQHNWMSIFARSPQRAFWMRKAHLHE